MVFAGTHLIVADTGAAYCTVETPAVKVTYIRLLTLRVQTAASFSSCRKDALFECASRREHLTRQGSRERVVGQARHGDFNLEAKQP